MPENGSSRLWDGDEAVDAVGDASYHELSYYCRE